MEKESEIQLLEALDQLEVCFSECVSQCFIYASCGVVILLYRKERPHEQVFALGPSTLRRTNLKLHLYFYS